MAVFPEELTHPCSQYHTNSWKHPYLRCLNIKESSRDVQRKSERFQNKTSQILASTVRLCLIVLVSVFYFKTLTNIVFIQYEKEISLNGVIQVIIYCLVIDKINMFLCEHILLNSIPKCSNSTIILFLVPQFFNGCIVFRWVLQCRKLWVISCQPCRGGRRQRF